LEGVSIFELNKKIMRTVLTADEARDILMNHFPTFIDIFNKSKESVLRSIDSDTNKGITFFAPSYKTMMMWHYVVNISSQDFANDNEFKPVIINQVFGLLYHDALFLRFKKLNSKHLTSNIPTLQSMTLNSQGSIPGFPESPCIINVGYVIDKTFTNFKSINITCPKSNTDLHWQYDILNDVANEKTLRFSFDAGAIDNNVSPGIEKLLKIKEEKKKGKLGNGHI
jgi:hypothetical protein